MFANKLTPEQRQVVFDLAANLAAADNDVSEEEIGYLQSFSEAYGIEYNLDKVDINYDDLLTVLDTKASRIITLQELIKLSYKDGHFGKEEQDKVFLIAQKMGLNDASLIMRIEKWVRQGFDWVYEGEQMLELD
ncbi:TerB family tellurite resistance protein [Thiomicrorhabdus sediminis]|uniref:TerB family tellurite resistance protein n=1 Tax=Thiomicrorhabdus sediminis TaxID=2580412 RepID=A0A4P9K8H0_9GAMM|nr:TerB family tellurite resistance protein [Thiomicrorhabdus sediminis]QCU90607.1 TerB family tellurite resistance protein [Thiomicrorhabdus sediminis]